MKKGEVIALLIMFSAVLVVLFWLFGGLITRGAKVENLAVLIGTVQKATQDGRVAEPFKSEAVKAAPPVNITADVNSLITGAPWQQFPGGYWDGKFPPPVAAIDLDSGRYDAIRRALPNTARADTAEAARTLVFIRCKNTKVGKYGYILSYGAYKMSCNLLAVDMKAPGGPEILDMNSFESFPPDEIDLRFKWFGDVVAERPDAAMADFVTNTLQK